MAIKKSELYSSIWKSCDELRGSMDASQYKDYVLVLLFVKYVSDKYAGQPYAPVVVPEGGSFADMQAAKGKTNIGERLNTVVTALAKANRLEGIINTADFDDSSKLGDGKEMQDRLTNLIAIFENPALDFSQNRADGDDLLGDAYEYLMRNFATQSGKSKGQFYTPAEVSRVMARIIGLHTVRSAEETIYDPTCGSGSLLLKAADEVPAHISGITLYGQEKDNSTRALAKMNMILHNHVSATIVQGNTLSNPQFKSGTKLLTFDFAVANPPFSDKAWSNGLTPEADEYDRFIDGIPPRKNGDYAYLQHLIRSLKSTGRGAIILPHGVLFRGNVEGDIRQNIIRRGYLKGIIGLPPNLFYGTGIPACIIVIDKANADPERGIFMIDASRDYMKDGSKNRLRHQDVHKIVDVFNQQIELPRYSRLVPIEEIRGNGYNLNIPRYIDTREPDDLQDIAAHLSGGIPDHDLDALDRYWQVMPGLRSTLFQPSDRAGYSDLRVEPSAIKATILEHPEFTQYAAGVAAVFETWRAKAATHLAAIQPGASPKALIRTLTEDLLHTFSRVPLIDSYDLYQHLMTYWSATMQDDIDLIAVDGWEAAKTLRLLVKKDKKYTEEHDLEVGRDRYKAEVLPPALLIQRWFPEQQTALTGLLAAAEAVAQALAALDEEHAGEDSLLADARTDTGSLTHRSVTARLKLLDPQDVLDEPERTLLQQVKSLIDEETALREQAKSAEIALYSAVVSQYPALTVDDLKIVLIADKWLPAVAHGVQTELDRVSQLLTERIRQLADRYATPLSELERAAQEYAQRVNEHLKRLGYRVQ